MIVKEVLYRIQNHANDTNIRGRVVSGILILAFGSKFVYLIQHARECCKWYNKIIEKYTK
jgi:hypothetical protein